MMPSNKLDDEASLDFSLVIASSVHDMKNSLGMLLNSLEEVLEYSPPQDELQKKTFATLQYEASRINSELIQLLTIYRFDQDSLAFHIDESYVIETFEDQIARNDVLFKTKNVDVSLRCDPDLIAYYDNELVGNVIHNILINAARYAQSKIIVSGEIIDKQLVLKIEDDGEGFPDFMINTAHNESSNIKRHAGDSTQLGLFFAAKIARLHKQDERCGTIKLSNGGELGGGVFEIFLP